MSERARTTIAGITLVNWKGVFFQEYRLDGTVTALEGVNGAGKTTVMVAAFTALFPDQRWLDFENVAVAGKSKDRGIHGRLGLPGPAWAVLDVHPSHGGRWLVGVHLLRLADRKVQLDPFVVEDVPADATVQDLLLLDAGNGRAQVPDPAELDQHLGRLGLGLRRLEPQRYFEELFELGVLSAPLRTQAERGRFFELLQTSLMGGLSDKVRRGLREYLLREDGSVAGAVKRMQDNLAECRSTKEQLERFEHVHQRIGEVHDTGLEMFALGVHATRRRAEELELKALQARERLDFQRRRAEAARTAMEAADRARQDAEVARKEARATHTGAVDRARRVAEAHRLAGERDQARARLEEADHALRETGRALERDQEQLDAAKAEERRARAAYSDVGSRKTAQATAWEEVTRRVGRYRQARQALEHARQAHPGVLAGDDQAACAALPQVRAATQAQLTAVRTDIRARARQLEQADDLALAFGHAHACLQRLVAVVVDEDQALDTALSELQRLDDWQQELAALPQLQRERSSLKDQVDRQQRARQRAAEITHPLGRLTTRDLVTKAHEQDNTGLAELETLRASVVQQRDDAALAAKTIETRLPDLVADGRRWASARELARDLGLEPSSTAVDAAVRDVDRDRDEVAQELGQLKATRSALEQRRASLETPGRARDPRLDTVASLVGGRPVLDLLDATPLDQAGEIEARLGPDIDGIVVDDPGAAAQLVAGLDDAPAQVILLPSLAIPRATDITAHAVTVEDVEGWRVTRLPAEPMVGEAARRHAVEQLSEEIHRLDMREDELTLRNTERTARRSRLVHLLGLASWLDREDPQTLVARAEHDLAKARRADAEARRTLRDIVDRVKLLQHRRSALEGVIPDAALLDLPDLPAQLDRLTADIARLRERETHLRAVEADRRSLRASTDALRTLPLPVDERARLRVELEAEEAREVQLDALDAALAVIDPEALGWADQEHVLAGRQAMLAALEEEENAAARRLEVAAEAQSRAQDAYAGSVKAHAQAQGEYGSAQSDLASAQRRLDALDVPDASADAVARANRIAEEARQEASRADVRHTSAVEAATRAEGAFQAASEREQAGQLEADRTAGEAAPWTTRWDSLKQAVAGVGLLPTITTARWQQETDQEGGVNLSKRATEVRKRLRLALRDAGDHQQILLRLDTQPEGDEGSGQRYLDDWQEVRRWVLDRVPREVSESDDPSRALARLGERIDTLRQTLARGEKRLRTDAGEIARSIRSRYDRERRRMSKLNKDLAGAGFGSIDGMKVQLTWRDRMYRLLETLQDQKTLFRTDLPLEEALAALYQAQGGGKVKGERLLDYREYLDVDLQIRRRGEQRWVSSRDQGVSTGEAIGVGAAVLMVVLSAWEEDYRLARSKSGVQPLRFLFLDEASRLSTDSLSVLFELCRRMQIQMLVAAPYVPPEPGAVVYRLVRGLDADGQDVVVATGRRFVGQT